MKTYIKTILLVGTIAPMPGMAFAQALEAAKEGDQAASTDSSEIVTEVIVTARKRSERLNEIPATIEVFSASDLAPVGNFTLNDLSTKLPNFFITSPRATRISVTMRGLGVPGVGLYIDGVYQPSDVAFSIPLFDVERVEVLKGPQGTLYGRNAYSGAISYVTRAPSNVFEGEVNAELGNADTQRGSATVAGPIVEDLISARVSGSMQRRSGFRNFSDGSDADRDNFDAFSGRVTITPTSNLTADLKYSYVDKLGPSFLYHQVADIDDKHGHLRVTPRFGASTGALAGSRQQSRVRSDAYSGRLTYSADSFELTSTSALTKLRFSDTFDIDTIPSDFFAARGTSALHDFSQEVRALSAGEGPFKWLVGGYYNRGKVGECGGCGNVLGGAVVGGGSLFQKAASVHYEGYAAFTDLEYRLTEHVVIGAGARYDEIEQELRPPGGMSADAKFHGFQPKLTARYQFDPDTQLYGTISKGFTQGGFNAPLVGSGSALATFPNQELWSYETGFKTSFDDRRGDVSVALFYIDAESFNAAATVPTPLGPRVAIVNVGKVESYGLEVDTSYRATPELMLELSGGYNPVEPTVLSPNTAPGIGNVGEQFQRAPEWSYRAAATYTQPLSSTLSLELNGAVNAVGPTRFCGEAAVFGPCPVRDTYYLVDASSTLVWSRYRLSLFARNLFNTTYVSDFLAQSALAQFGGPAAGSVYGDPRYWGVRLNAQF
jgi:iron complex outermembrane recepter protein